MRETNRVITVAKTIQEKITLNREEITAYTVYKQDKNITVTVRLTGDETSRVETETYRFFNDDYINEPTEVDLWRLIDKKRSGK